MKFTKTLLSIMSCGLLLTFCKNADKASANTQTAVVAGKTAIVGKVETASFHIEGMTCAVMCAAKIEKELSAMDGVRKAKVDFDKKTATVDYDNAKQTPQKLAQKVESVADGKTYKVSDITSSADRTIPVK